MYVALAPPALTPLSADGGGVQDRSPRLPGRHRCLRVITGCSTAPNPARCSQRASFPTPAPWAIVQGQGEPDSPAYPLPPSFSGARMSPLTSHCQGGQGRTGRAPAPPPVPPPCLPVAPRHSRPRAAPECHFLSSHAPLRRGAPRRFQRRSPREPSESPIRVADPSRRRQLAAGGTACPGRPGPNGDTD